MDARQAAILPCRAARVRQRRARRTGGRHVAQQRAAAPPPARRHSVRSDVGAGARRTCPAPRRSLRGPPAPRRPAAARLRRACRVPAACPSRIRRIDAARVPRRRRVGAASVARRCRLPAAYLQPTCSLPAAYPPLTRRVGVKTANRVNFVSRAAPRLTPSSASRPPGNGPMPTPCPYGRSASRRRARRSPSRRCRRSACPGCR